MICFIFGLGIIGTGSDLLMKCHIFHDFIGTPIFINTTLIVVFGTLLVFLTFLGCFGITGSPNKECRVCENDSCLIKTYITLLGVVLVFLLVTSIATAWFSVRVTFLVFPVSRHRAM